MKRELRIVLCVEASGEGGEWGGERDGRWLGKLMPKIHLLEFRVYG
jgi:hypothetical protein